MISGERPSGIPALLERIRERGANPVGVALVGVGTVLILLSFTVLEWFGKDVAASIVRTSGRSTRFGDIRPYLDQYRAYLVSQNISGYFSFGAAGPYFQWLGWVLLVLAFAASAAAVSGLGRDHWWYRWTGAVVSVLAGGLTLMALDLVIPQGNPPASLGLLGFGGYIGSSSVGAWAAMLGFLLMAIASLLPRRGY